MEWLSELSPWVLALLIFLVRVVDVSIGTLRTICVVQGRMALSVVLGFFEVLIWIAALSQVIIGVSDSPMLMVAYAGGFALGNAVGIGLERKLALGSVVVRIIAQEEDSEIVYALRDRGFRATTFEGEGVEGPVDLIYVRCDRRKVANLLKIAKAIKPNIFYTVEPVQEQSERFAEPLPHPTGWRSVLKMK
ncbi:DUF2179 domain-containing protein [Bremerella sp. T1]|uniref:DUF2179 domain-containing protein n=1 Tax=Bremerella sp. TYQ1 TaxID=3119568 RepID=UPI001CCFE08C|nr:DUF5698 domain-containing protein [Bremerella volcania]UBM34793.1 DUF5698 domain-containing protein [Bremerella volcania]